MSALASIVLDVELSNAYAEVVGFVDVVMRSTVLEVGMNDAREEVADFGDVICDMDMLLEL